MKKICAILAAAAGASVASVALYAGIRNKKKQKFEPVEVGLEPIGDPIEPTVDVVAPADEAAEEVGEPEPIEESRRVLMSRAIVLRLPEARRAIELYPHGEICCYEDDKVVRRQTFENWPKGSYEISCYFGRFGSFTWLFFRKISEGESHFCELSPNLKAADHVVVVDEDLMPISISYGKDAQDGQNNPTLGFRSGNPENFHGGKEVLLVYSKTEHELRRLAYKGEEDNKLYACEVSRSEASMRNQEFELDEYELMGWRIVGRIGKYYMVRDLGIPGDSTGSPCYYEDKFGKVDFERFKEVCRADLVKPGMGIFSSFYRTVTPLTIKEAIKKAEEGQ